MKSIYFLSLNMIPFVPYNYGVLRSYAEQNGIIAENYQWHEPIWKFEPTEDIIEKTTQRYIEAYERLTGEKFS